MAPLIHRDPVFRDALAEAGPWPRVLAEALVLALVLILLVAAVCGLALIGWGAAS
jgi:hypothetical protein